MKKDIDLMEKCLDEMYQASTPSITWSQIITKYENTNIQFFRLYEIKETDYDRIKNKYQEKIDKCLWRSMDMTLLSYAPTFKEKK